MDRDDERERRRDTAEGGEAPPWPIDAISETVTSLEGLVSSFPHSIPLVEAHQRLQLTWDFFRELISLPEVPGFAPAEARASLGAVTAALRRVRVVVHAISAARVPTTALSRDLSDAVSEVEQALQPFLVEFQRVVVGSTIGEASASLLNRYLELLDSRKLLQETRGVRDAAVEVLSSARRAAGVTGETGLAFHFADYSQRELRTANKLRTAAVVLMLVITAVAGVFLFAEGGSGLSSEELAKLALTLPLAALATYLAREASSHRSAAQWAGELEVQLLTVDAFTESLPEDLRDGIRLELGRRVFSPRSLHGNTENGPSIVGDVAGLLSNVAEVVRTSAGLSSKP